jgi:hypothetical protein
MGDAGGPGASTPGKYALYTRTERKPRTVTIECSGCREETRVSLVELAALMFPVHLHLPVLKYHSSWMKCPACGRRTWVRMHVTR